MRTGHLFAGVVATVALLSGAAVFYMRPGTAALPAYQVQSDEDWGPLMRRGDGPPPQETVATNDWKPFQRDGSDGGGAHFAVDDSYVKSLGDIAPHAGGNGEDKGTGGSQDSPGDGPRNFASGGNSFSGFGSFGADPGWSPGNGGGSGGGIGPLAMLPGAPAGTPNNAPSSSPTSTPGNGAPPLDNGPTNTPPSSPDSNPPITDNGPTTTPPSNPGSNPPITDNGPATTPPSNPGSNPPIADNGPTTTPPSNPGSNPPSDSPSDYGKTPANPIVPTDGPNGPTYLVQQGNGWQFFDPLVAVGYRYKLVPDGDQTLTFGISGIQVPTHIGDGVYDLFLCRAGDTTLCDFDTGQHIIANDGDTTQNIFDVIAYLEGLTPDQLAELGITDPEDGITAFALRGIDPGAGLDPNDPLAFITGLLFTGVVDGTVVITPEVIDPPDAPQVPEPASLSVLASALLLMGWRQRQRRRG